jgi:cytochrome P450 family 4
MNENVDILVEKLASAAQKNSVVKINEVISLLTLDVIVETAMGSKIDAQLNSENEYIKAVHE